MPALVCVLVQYCFVLFHVIFASRDCTSYAATSSKQDDPPRCTAICRSVFDALSIADLHSLCVQHALTSTGTQKKLECRLWGLTTPSLGQIIGRPAAQLGPKRPQQLHSSSKARFHRGPNAGDTTTDEGQRATV